MYKNGKPNYNEIVFSEEQEKDIIDSYLSGESSVKISKRLGLKCHKPILKVLHRNGIDVCQKRFVRKYALDEDYFEVIDSPEKAYILGLLYSDGSNNPKKGTVSISLQEEDYELLEQIRILINSEKPLEYLDYSNKHDFGYSYKNQYRLLLFSSKICKDLENLGVYPNKSLKVKFPTFLEDQYYSHFVRGVFDGDGSIYSYYKNENNTPVIVTITATNDFCQGLKLYIENHLGIHCGIYEASCHNGITKVFSLSGRNLPKVFLDWMYKDATIYLQRKYDRFIEYYHLDDSLLA